MLDKIEDKDERMSRLRLGRRKLEVDDELRQIRLESLQMRMRSYRRAGIYDRAYKDAKTIWDLMTV